MAAESPTAALVPDLLVPDLLDPTPRERVDVASAKLAVGFAFASGVSGGLFAEALARASLSPSGWDPASFADDLFLESFCATSFKAPVHGEPAAADVRASTANLVRLLSHPPRELAVLEYRRAIAVELDGSRELRSRLEGLHACLCRFRDLLEGATGTGKWDPLRRQLDLLAIVKEVFDALAGFEGARSGLARLGAFGKRVREGEPYRSLSDLLRYDEDLATVDLKVRVGADGKIRGFQVISAVEDASNPFVLSPVRRWLSKLELFARGYRFGEGEVMARLVDAVFAGVEEDVARLVQLFGDVELYLAALAFAERARAAGLAVCMPELVAASEPRVLEGLFNPLLLSQAAAPVPCSLTVDRHAATVLVTGPNSGGKTRLLQAVGICQVLAQSGLFVPAARARLALAPALVVSLSQQTTADQTEGRLGMELLRIRSLFERLPRGAMVILDELCSGTNPSEGEEIFELVVRMLTRLSPQAFITTHFLAFAARLEQDRAIDDLRFFQVELGSNSRPTYQFVPGVAKTSLAGQAAERLGVTAEQLLSLIEKNAALAPAQG